MALGLIQVLGGSGMRVVISLVSRARWMDVYPGVGGSVAGWPLGELVNCSEAAYHTFWGRAEVFTLAAWSSLSVAMHSGHLRSGGSACRNSSRDKAGLSPRKLLG